MDMEVNWPKATVSVELTRQAVQDAPLYNSSEKLTREQELEIFKYYGRVRCWEDEVECEKAK